MNDDIKIAKEKLEEAKKYLKEGNYNNTVAYCNKALNFARFSSDKDMKKEIYYLLGLAHSALRTYYTEWDINDSILACKYFRKVIELDKDFVGAYLSNGMAILKWGNNYELAKADFEKVLELEPDNELARKELEFCNKQLEKEDSIDD